MFKIYQLHIYKRFVANFLILSFIFFSLIVIMSVLEEISFFKNINHNYSIPYLLTFLIAPSILFEIFPFIFLLSTQFLIFDLYKKDELVLLKRNGLKNFSLIKNLFFLSIIMGLFNILIFYNVSAFLKFNYSKIKNSYSSDNKYLAMAIPSGLWIHDNVGNQRFIIKSEKVENVNLVNNKINVFDKNFKLIEVIQSKVIDISSNNWTIYNPEITKNNKTIKINEDIKFYSNFDINKINSFFRDVTTIDLTKILNLKKEYEKLGYSTDEITVFALRIISMPLFYGILTILGAILMINSRHNKSYIFLIITGILISVIIYYVSFIFNALGNNGKIPAIVAVFFPIIILSMISAISLVRINEK